MKTVYKQYNFTDTILSRTNYINSERWELGNIIVAALKRVIIFQQHERELAQFYAPAFTALCQRRLQCIRFGQLELQVELRVVLQVEL